MKYSLATDSWDDKEFEAIERVIKSKNFTMGEEVKQTENKFAEYFGSKYCVMSNSGSSANLLAIASLIYSGRLNKGDEVIVPAVSWSTTYNPLQQYGLKVVFVDVDLATLNYDLEALKNSITKSTKMIFIVNLLGNNNDFDKINIMAEINNLIIIEDNCESMGSKYNDKYSGTFGLIGTFSSFFSHHISSMEGGYCLTDDYELYNYMKSIRAHGWTREVDTNGLDNIATQSDFYKYFDFVLPGYNLRPLEIEAAIASVQLDKLKSIVKTRRSNALYFLKKAKNNPLFFVQEELGESSWFGFSIVLKDKYKEFRDELAEYLISNNIDCRPIVTGNFTRHHVINYFDYKIHGILTNADYIHDYGLFIGNNGKIIYKQIDYFYKTIENFLEKIDE